ncbi:MAG: 4-(cytidine 5'-diphospho)-2-C-methyl-D-erythritol kinase [Bacteroidales bacterium]|nr:4-(cytidine 5'-diphospho)-2-C-methyl-D-erythritol kinase [Bacteroidales bacterium]
MLKFVNAKLNLGLDIVRKREDGYHDLSTVFYPVGLHNGTPENPEPFCDVIEITEAAATRFEFTGRAVDCPLEKNLVYKAWNAFREAYPSLPEYCIRLEKHLPDGAGLGGGSADATFVLRMLNEMNGRVFDDARLEAMALRLGADCPFFVRNRACFAEGVGEKMQDLDLNLAGWWCALVKPDLSIPTRDAFAGVTPRVPDMSLKEIVALPIREWRGLMKNDFEKSLFPKYPLLAQIKDAIYSQGAVYASMSGSGSTVFGLFPTREAALQAIACFPDCYTTVSLL